jgi:glycosyltransferase involved in cell wall biosynthesis
MRLPLIVRISGAYEMNLGYLSSRRGIRVCMARWLLRRADRVIVLNSEIEQRLLALGVLQGRLLKMPNAIPDRFFNIKRVPDRSRSASVLQMGRLDQFKGGAVMLRAWRIVVSEYPDAVLRFVGDGPELNRLEALARELGIGHNVVFCGTSIETPGFYSSADVFVLPSLMEGMPNALLEAMAAGLACVASDLSGTHDIIEHGRSGLLVPPGVPVPLAAAVVRLLGDEAERKSLGQAARERVKPWAMSCLVETHLRLHAEICEARHGVGRKRGS